MSNDNKPADTLDIGKAGPILKQVYGGKKKKKKEEEQEMFSKIRNIIKKQKKTK